METAKSMRPVRFGFEDVGPFDGFTDGSTWNGWLNVWVKPETHEKVLAAFPDDPDAFNDYGDVDENGLVCYAMGLATSEWDEETPTPYQAWVDSREKLENLGTVIDEMDGCEGLVYQGGSWIEASKDGDNWTFSTIVGREEFASPNLGAVEWWLWNAWAKDNG